VDSPLVTRSNVLIALNEPSLEKFLPFVEPGGIVLYNGASIPESARRDGVEMHAFDFFTLSDEQVGTAKAGNIVALGALIEATHLLPVDVVERAMARVVKGEKWLEIDRRALAGGIEAMKGACCHA
jgi:Pyruvate/2-oxoacid:ferredoxin oxidoreductase gamma subunit